MAEEKKRKLWIDVIRAFAIIFVVIVHTVSWHEGVKIVYNVFVGPIMLPLFFAISGYVFNDRNGKQLEFYKRLMKGFVFPGLFLSLIWMDALMIPSKGFAYFADEFYQLISGKDAWFYTAFIIAQVLFFYTRKYFKPIRSTCIVSGLVFLAGFVMAKLDIGNFAMFNRACIAQAYFLLGFLFRAYEDRLSKIQWRYVLCGVAAYLLLMVVGLLLWPQRYLDIHLNQYNHIPYSLLMIFVGCVTAFLLAKKLNVAPKFLVYIGQNTLVIYFLHGKGFNLYNRVLSMLNIEQRNTLLLTILKVCFSIIVCCVVAFILTKFTPELVGKTRKKAKKIQTVQ